MWNKAGIVLRPSIRYVIAVLASSAGAVASLTLGMFGGKYAVDHGIANGYVTAVTISVISVALIPAYKVKKLLVDYCSNLTLIDIRSKFHSLPKSGSPRLMRFLL